MTPNEWIAGYSKAWHEADADAAVALFTEDGVYCSYLLEEPAVGHAGVHGYWSTVCSTQSEVDAQFGEPITSGNKTVVEFWTRMKNAGEPVTVLGAMLLRFAGDGRCEELREYWHFVPGDHAPPALWGR